MQSIDKNILLRIGAAILEQNAAPRNECPVKKLLPTTSEARKCAESSRTLELFQAYRFNSFAFEKKITFY